MLVISTLRHCNQHYSATFSFFGGNRQRQRKSSIPAFNWIRQPPYEARTHNSLGGKLVWIHRRPRLINGYFRRLFSINFLLERMNLWNNLRQQTSQFYALSVDARATLWRLYHIMAIISFNLSSDHAVNSNMTFNLFSSSKFSYTSWNAINRGEKWRRQNELNCIEPRRKTLIRDWRAWPIYLKWSFRLGDPRNFLYNSLL